MSALWNLFLSLFKAFVEGRTKAKLEVKHEHQQETNVAQDDDADLLHESFDSLRE